MEGKINKREGKIKEIRNNAYYVELLNSIISYKATMHI